MKKVTFLILLMVSSLITSCNQQTLESYNDTIVLAHKILLETNNNFYVNCEKYLGKPESKKELLKLIAETKNKLSEARKPVEALVPFKDHGLRKTILEMYTNSQDSMDFFAANVNLITEPDTRNKALTLFAVEYSKFVELDKLIKELQVQYAYYNNGTLR
jgi:YesN/AraC family two-component response regulator